MVCSLNKHINRFRFLLSWWQKVSSNFEGEDCEESQVKVEFLSKANRLIGWISSTTIVELFSSPSTIKEGNDSNGSWKTLSICFNQLRHLLWFSILGFSCREGSRGGGWNLPLWNGMTHEDAGKSSGVVDAAYANRHGRIFPICHLCLNMAILVLLRGHMPFIWSKKKSMDAHKSFHNYQSNRKEHFIILLLAALYRLTLANCVPTLPVCSDIRGAVPSTVASLLYLS